MMDGYKLYKNGELVRTLRISYLLGAYQYLLDEGKHVAWNDPVTHTERGYEWGDYLLTGKAI